MTDERGSRGPRVGVIGYGSILAPDEFEDVLETPDAEVLPVKVTGFSRLFNQEASWRETEGLERGVLNVVRDEGSWFNAVLLANLSRDEFRRYRRRERGYRLVEVERHAITPYQTDDEHHLDRLDLILVATGKKTRDDIIPIRTYIDICLRGADHWGEEFASDFMETSKLASEEPLRSYLKRE